MLSQQLPTVNLQQEDKSSFDEVLRCVRESLPAEEPGESDAWDADLVDDAKNASFHVSHCHSFPSHLPVPLRHDMNHPNIDSKVSVSRCEFQELLELAQRKFLRQVAQFAEETGVVYPRLLLVDFVSLVRGADDPGALRRYGSVSGSTVCGT